MLRTAQSVSANWLPNLRCPHYAAPRHVPDAFKAAPSPPMRSLLAACRTRWKRLSPLTRDVTFVLVLKATALGILWSLFFSAPLARHMSLVPDRVAERLVSPSPSPQPERANDLR
jgi:hypothetical protein